MTRSVRPAPTAALLLTLFAVTAFTTDTAPTLKDTRSFTFVYDVQLKDLPAQAQRAKIWIPLAVSGPAQTVTVEDIASPVRTTETRDPEYGNRMLFAEVPLSADSAAHFTVRYRVTRRLYSGQPGVPSGESAPLDRYLQRDSLVPIDGKMKSLADEITQGKREPKDIARSIYDYVFTTMRYDKSGTGWGRGDAIWACDAKRGNCTDFHSLFIALMRAEKIPARFEIGFPLPGNTTEGNIAGYHCWAEFYVDGQGWIPVDISEAWKAPALRDTFFGHLDVNRMQFTIGRDITLSPRQDGDPLNYFIYPYVEVDGKPYTAVEEHFSFRDIPKGDMKS
jgi:transglutaminase-like putative cysteine protease